jgi:hypothetical protein
MMVPMLMLPKGAGCRGLQAEVERVKRDEDRKKDSVEQMSGICFSSAFLDDPFGSSSLINKSIPGLTTMATASGVISVD